MKEKHLRLTYACSFCCCKKHIIYAALATDHTQRGVTGLELCKVSIFVFKLNVWVNLNRIWTTKVILECFILC